MRPTVLGSSLIFPSIFPGISLVGILAVFLCVGCASGGGGGDDDVSATAGGEGIIVGSSPDVSPVDSPSQGVGGQGANGGPSLPTSPDAAQDPDTPAGSAPPPADQSTLRVTTFNVGLLPGFVPFAAERLAPLQEALAAHDADVLCLQEVWLTDYAARLRSITSRYPYLHVPQPRQKFSSQTPVCSPEEIEPLFSCLAEKCLFDGGEFTQCALSNCYGDAEQLAAENPQCAGAIFAQAGQAAAALLEIQLALFGDTRAPLFSFGGSSGLMLASRYELEDVRELDFFDVSTTSRRAAVFATVRVNGREHVVSCTHLSSNLDGLVPYTGSFGSWEGEAREQARRLVAFADQYAGGRPQLLAGDFNCSVPNGRGAGSDFESVCRAFAGSGYRDLAATELSCTFCTDNLLNLMNEGIAPPRNLVLDHIYLKGTGSVQSVQRVFEETATVAGIESTLSDHYGVRITVSSN